MFPVEGLVVSVHACEYQKKHVTADDDDATAVLLLLATTAMHVPQICYIGYARIYRQYKQVVVAYPSIHRMYV